MIPTILASLLADKVAAPFLRTGLGIDDANGAANPAPAAKAYAGSSDNNSGVILVAVIIGLLLTFYLYKK